MATVEWEALARSGGAGIDVIPRYDHRGKQQIYRCDGCKRREPLVIAPTTGRHRGLVLCQYCYNREVSRAESTHVT